MPMTSPGDTVITLLRHLKQVQTRKEGSDKYYLLTKLSLKKILDMLVFSHLGFLRQGMYIVNLNRFCCDLIHSKALSKFFVVFSS